ncbi:transcription factor Ouib-like [Drosophila willistoni]|uniref:transcription factor Ouib-like n=1 Tax=Drosophila willistoni TaxID=7260 RepID=UPI000C26D90F|nr:transcription factor Ouib-like [Drosophila willistoni]
MPIYCRLCNEEIHNRNAPNIFEGEHIDILKNVAAITGIRLLNRPQIPQHICASCHLDLNHLMVFRERCIKTQKTLLKSMDKSNTPQKNPDPLNTSTRKAADSPVQAKRAIVKIVAELPPKKQATSETMTPSPVLAEPDFITLPESTSLPSNQSSGKRKRVPASGVPELVCDKCGKCFKDPSNLKLHLVRHTGVKNFECALCGEKFFSQHLLNLHDRVRHQGERPYKCKFCGLQFLTSTARCRHERIRHIRTLSFKCKYCDKGFIVQSDLKKHEFLHSGERPHRCEICNIGFPRSTNLKLHFRSKTHQKKANAASVDQSYDVDDEINYKLIYPEDDENCMTETLIEEYVE